MLNIIGKTNSLLKNILGLKESKNQRLKDLKLGGHTYVKEEI